MKGDICMRAPTSGIFLVSTNGKLYFKKWPDSAQASLFHSPPLQKEKKNRFSFLYNLGLLGKDWGTSSGFEVNVWLSLTLTGGLCTEKTDPMFLNAWAMIHTGCKEPFCFMPTVAVLGLRITVGCPFKTVHPSTVNWECLWRKDVMAKQCTVPGMVHHSNIMREGFWTTLLLDHFKKRD